jgi:feruloyl-CoA synthase
MNDRTPSRSAQYAIRYRPLVPSHLLGGARQKNHSRHPLPAEVPRRAFGVTRVRLRRRARRALLEAELPLAAYPRRVTDFLLHWAETDARSQLPGAARGLAGGATGDWQHLSYAQALDGTRHRPGAAGPRPERRAARAGPEREQPRARAAWRSAAFTPACPTAPCRRPTATAGQDFDKLRHVVDTLTPGLVYATDGARYGRAMSAMVTTWN